jgi:drug/metabolite transporter (DMT)-like permease
MLGHILFLLVGVAAGAASIIFIKMSALHPLLLASYRLLLAALLLSPFYFRELARERRRLPGVRNPALESGAAKVERGIIARSLTASVIPGLLLGLHFIAWIAGARMTSAANATLIVNMAPVAMPVAAYIFMKEIITPAEIAGTVLALGGVVFLGISDFHVSMETFRGDVLSFVAMLFFTVYLILGKRKKRQINFWLYLVPLYFIGGVFCFIVSLFFTSPLRGISWFETGMIAGLAAISTIGGHSIYNYSMRHLRSQLVTLVNQSQVLFGALFGLLFFAEIPERNFFIATPIILGGIILAIIFSRKKKEIPAASHPPDPGETD